ncbi:UNVERIFIED_CONTAM: Eugenol synthase 1 [Sesamum radiatum]|uniref:Eugenol synthase 1 n=1 Tax=Sesamum radiatum TaxID=300843 RepID=A0AAW2PX58_SESRA
MEVQKNKSKILVFGGTGYIGSYMVKASIKLGHPTYVFSRPNSHKTEMLNQLQSMGAIIVNGTMDEHDRLVSLLREVDVVISALAYPQVLDQLKIIEAIKVAGNIKRFLPSDFGVEEDRVSVLPPFEAFLEKKRKIRRAVEAANIPYTFVSANCFGAYFVNFLLRPYEQKQEIVTVYGSGEAKGEDFNHISLLAHFSEDDVEASALYPDLKVTTIDELLNIFLCNPPKPVSAAFE